MSDQQNNDIEIITEHDENNSTELSIPSQSLPDKIYLLPVSHKPFLPTQVQSLVIDIDPWQETIERVINTDHKILGLSYAPLDEDSLQFAAEDFNVMGTVVQLHKVEVKDDKIHAIVEGLHRFQINHWIRRQKPFLVQVNYPYETQHDPLTLKASSQSLVSAIRELLPLNPLYSEELKQYVTRFGADNPALMADFAASMTSAEANELQDVLDTIPVIERITKVLVLLSHELELAKLRQHINKEVNQTLDENQREFFLREQLKVIQKELGISKDEKSGDEELFTKRFEALNPPEHVQTRFDDEMTKLKALEPSSAEYGVTRNYLEWLTSVPWGKLSEDKLDLHRARETLDKHHYGLSDIKDRIIEFIAVGALKNKISGSIMLLIGPPGVGKTSIGQSIAHAVGRPFYRFSVGGMRDEAEIKGHRRTYIGAMPGKLVQALKEVSVSNPVVMLDEVDKIGSSYQGDPASALLEVLDPEQNDSFLDHYLDLRLDLSKILFICTANQLDTIPAPLLDRMDMIHLAGYLSEEKIAIAKNHLWPKLLERNGLREDQVCISDTALAALVENYARESGVRNLEKLLNRIMRKAAVTIVNDASARIAVDDDNLSEYLGGPRFKPDNALSGIGIVTGLAWTSMGGATLPIEVVTVHNKGRALKLTGKLGEVMQESAHIAYSYVLANLKQLGATDIFENASLHLHVPEGATPKDGPSAGITIATALVSLARNKKVKDNIAMTGEVTLTGKVLAVGGIREKIIAAKRANIKHVILPELNRSDWDELPDYIQQGITVDFASHYEQVCQLAFD